MRSTLRTLTLLAATPALAQTSAPIPAPSPAPLHEPSPLDLRQTTGTTRDWPAAVRKSRSSPRYDTCPIAIAAQLQGMPEREEIVAIEDANRPRNLDPFHGDAALHVHLAARNAPLAKVKLAVSYVIPTTGILLVSQPGLDPPTQQKTYELTAPNDPAPTLEATLRSGTVAHITRVHILTIQYADGTLFEPATNNTCSLKISPFVLVSAP
jgi:hypothetical protein